MGVVIRRWVWLESIGSFSFRRNYLVLHPRTSPSVSTHNYITECASPETNCKIVNTFVTYALHKKHF